MALKKFGGELVIVNIKEDPQYERKFEELYMSLFGVPSPVYIFGRKLSIVKTLVGFGFVATGVCF